MSQNHFLQPLSLPRQILNRQSVHELLEKSKKEIKIAERLHLTPEVKTKQSIKVEYQEIDSATAYDSESLLSQAGTYVPSRIDVGETLNLNFATPDNILKANLKYQDLLIDRISKLDAEIKVAQKASAQLLEQSAFLDRKIDLAQSELKNNLNEHDMKLIRKQIGHTSNSSDKTIKIGYFMAPYFKTPDSGFGPLKNSAAVEREKLLGNFKDSNFTQSTWTKASHTLLKDAVLNWYSENGLKNKKQNIEDQLLELNSEIEKISNNKPTDKEGKKELKKRLTKLFQAQATIKRGILELERQHNTQPDPVLYKMNSNDIDWREVSMNQKKGELSTQGKTPFRCALKFKNCVASEGEKIKQKILKSIVDDSSMEKNWVKIADEYQKKNDIRIPPMTLLREYKKSLSSKTDNEWTQSDNNYLKKCIQKLGVHEYVPEDTITSLFPTKAIAMVKSRINTLERTEKRSKEKKYTCWSAMEAIRLEYTVQKFGVQNLSVGIMMGWFPFKSKEQLSRHYFAQLPDYRKGGFTEKELVLLHEIMPQKYYDMKDPATEVTSVTKEFKSIAEEFNMKIQALSDTPSEKRKKRSVNQIFHTFVTVLHSSAMKTSFDEKLKEVAIEDKQKENPRQILENQYNQLKFRLTSKVLAIDRNQKPLDILESKQAFSDFELFQKIHKDLNTKRTLRPNFTTRWQNHYDVDTAVRNFYTESFYDPFENVAKNSSWIKTAKNEYQKLISSDNSAAASNFYTKLHQSALPANQANIAGLARLQDEMPYLMKRARESLNQEIRQSQVNDLKRFKKNDPKHEGVEHDEARKSTWSYNQQCFSPADAILRQWDYSTQRDKGTLPGGTENFNFEDLMDYEKLRISLGVGGTDNSIVPEVLEQGSLKKLCESVFKDDDDQTEVHNIAGQYKALTRTFNSLFTWPIIVSQNTPKPNYWGRFKSMNEAMAKKVGKKINKQCLKDENPDNYSDSEDSEDI